MALTKIDESLLDIIVKLADEPNDVGGMGAAELKAKFDEAGKLLANYINKTLIPEITSDIDAAAQGIPSGGGISGNILAPLSITDDKIANVNGSKIDDGTISTAKHVKGSITRELLADNAKTLRTEDFPNKVVPNRALADKAVTNVKIDDGAVNEIKINPESRTQYWTLAVGTSWVGDSAPFTQEIAANGIRVTDRPKVFFMAPGDFANLAAWKDAYRLLYDVDSKDGAIVLTAEEKTKTAITVLVEVSRI